MNLIKYDEARRAVSEAKSVDEVKEFLAGADAARAYAKQAKNRQLELDAIEIRTRAERRLGEMIIALQELGHCKPGSTQGNESTTTVITLRDLGIDGALSQVSQRLALVKADRFEFEVREWRSEVEQRPQGRILAPLQYVRNPSGAAGHVRESIRLRRNRLDLNDAFSKYVSPDGRRIADWRVGELRRLVGLFSRAASCAEEILSNLPVANADALATIESIFEREQLISLLQSCYERNNVPHSDAGIIGPRIEKARRARTKTCETCTKSFEMRSTDRAGRFCSRDCAFEFQRKGGKVGLKELRCVDDGPNPAR